MNKKVEGIVEFLSSKCTSIEDWEKELGAIETLEGLQGQVKKEIENKIKHLKKSQPKFYINKVYKRKGINCRYCFVIKGGFVYFYNITYNTYWQTGLKTKYITNFHSNMPHIRYLPFHQFEKMCKPGHINPLDIIPVEDNSIETIVETIDELEKDFEKRYGLMVRSAISEFAENLVKKLK